jgi:O-antigen/teichoic acid export membrane protein
LLVLLGRGGLSGLKLPERPELRESSSIMTSSILDFCVVWFSGLVLVAFSSMAEVAGFHVAQRLVILVPLVLIVVNSVSAPIYARAFRSNDIGRVSEVYRCTTVFTVVVALLPLLAYFAFPATLMGLFGSEYKSASMLLVVLAVGQLVNVLTGSVGYLLMLSGNADHYRRASLYSAAFTLIATWPLLYFLGALGAALAASAGVALKNILAALYVKKYVGVALTLSPDDLGMCFSRRRMNEILTYRD